MATTAAKLDLNLRPTVAPKASDWCQKRMEDVVGRGNHRTLLSEDIACLKEELQKIEPFSRDLSSIIAVVNYVIERLEEEVVPRKDDMDGDVSDLSSNVDGEDGRGKAASRDGHGDKKKWLDSEDLWRGYNKETGTETDRVSTKDEQEIANNEGTSEKLVLSRTPPPPPPPPQSTVGAQAMLDLPQDHRSFGSRPNDGMAAKQQRPPRKRRRCWSRELHGRFVDVLEELGGPQVAKPKQIKELMKVDGLTNDEVKSHLQKYRLRFKKRSPSQANHQIVWAGAPFSDHCSTGSNEVRRWRGDNERLNKELTV